MSSGRAWVLHPYDASDPRARARADTRLAEAKALSGSIGLDVGRGEAVALRRFTPATLLGAGKVEEYGDELSSGDVAIVIIDGVLSPIQQRNLERAWKTKVIDRTGLILEIFGARAQTREGVLQVELAALTYQRSRLVRSWTHLERQRGGLGFIGGPGESQIELDRRRIDERITKIREQLADVQRTRGLHRNARERVPYPVVALVGYTNAGKSTLFNKLTGSAVAAEDKLFATLDPTMRILSLPSGRQCVLADTVGFISDLPTMLVAAFRATLEEVVSADMLIHVRDIADPETDSQAKDVREVLAELDIDEIAYRERALEAWNKVDLTDGESRTAVRAAVKREKHAFLISALTGEGIDQLLETIDERLALGETEVVITIPASAGDVLSWLHRNCSILSCNSIESEHGESHLLLSVRMDDKRLGQFGDIYPNYAITLADRDPKQVPASGLQRA